MIYLTLFLEFFKIGLFAIGGGLATIPFLTDLASKYNWYTTAELTNMIAISESTPGPVGINMATYVGFTVGEVPGAITTTIGLITPSVIIILIVAKVLTNIKDNPHVNNAFKALRPAVTGLIASAGFQVFQAAFIMLQPESTEFFSIINWPAIILFIPLFIFQYKTNKHPIIVIAIACIIGIVCKL